MGFRGTTNEHWLYRGTLRADYAPVWRQVDDFKISSKRKQVLRYLIYGIIQKVSTISEDVITERFNGVDM